MSLHISHVLVVFGSNNVEYSLNIGLGTSIKHFIDAISFNSLARVGGGGGGWTSLFYTLTTSNASGGQ